MKKKVLKIGFLFVLIFFILLNTNAYAGIKTAAELSSTFNWLKTQDGYREGDVFNGSYGGASQCHGWALQVTNQLFGSHANASTLWTDIEYPNVTADSLCIGDIVRYNCLYNCDHSFVVTDIVGDTVYYADCNWGANCGVKTHPMYGNSICWNRSMSKAKVNEYLSYYCTENGHTNQRGRIIHHTQNDVKSYYNADLAIDSITNGKVYETGSVMNVEGWATSNTNENLQIFIDDTLIVVNENIERYQRDDIKQDNAGYRASIDLSKFSTGCHKLKVWSYENGTHASLTSKEVEFYISDLVHMPDEFVARIVLKNNIDYVVGIASTVDDINPNITNVELKNKNQNDISQLWKFVKVSGDNTYVITNLGNNMTLHVQGDTWNDGENIITYVYRGYAAQQFTLTSYNGGVRLVPRCSSIYQALDLANANVTEGANIQLHRLVGADNDAQTFTFEKAVTSITATSSMTLEVGGTKTISTTVSPSDAYNKKLSFTSGNTNVATVDANGKVTAKGSGTTTITVKTTDGSNISKTCNVTVENNNYANISYLTHIENVGYETIKSNGETAGRPGAKLRLEEIKIELDSNVSGTIEYRTHVQNVGWLDYVTEGNYSGTHGKGLRLEAIQIRLTGEIANYYDVYYRIHVEDEGWLGWAMNNQKAGSVGYAKKLEGIQVVLVEKGGTAPGTVGDSLKRKVRPTESYSKGDITKDGLVDSADMATFLNIDDPTDMEFITCDMNMDGFWNEIDMDIMKDYYILNSSPVISYTTHVQNVGWQKYVSDGAMAGTSNKGLRLEGIKIKLDKVSDLIPGSVKYSTHIQNIGWQDFRYDDEMSGTSGKGLRLEAIKIELEEELAKVYDVYYRVHAQNVGWLGWAKNGQESGTAGFGYRLEGIEIQLVEKDAPAPGSTTNCFVKK